MSPGCTGGICAEPLLSEVLVEPCVPGSAGQLQTAFVRGYCYRVGGCFRPRFVSSGTKPTITKKVCDCVPPCDPV